ncbi:hypothetical protein [Actinomadura citrea]|uniref:Tetratricopeptide repeat protein n=1 Tax=Actinomadura citrea TaxID=46158 RepID=A0A7Y9GE77_9ACTN|nr:hypothetical protein [Actinomadura citrea]NYE14851.1 hypothetical protein [Actinomadura citrea]GGT82441.1 hypothetical protein GCM10010177_46830 [Actinomadura citrea]
MGDGLSAEDLGALYGARCDQDQAIPRLKEALDGYRQAGADRDRPRVRRRLRELGIRHRHWTSLPGKAVTGGGTASPARSRPSPTLSPKG